MKILKTIALIISLLGTIKSYSQNSFKTIYKGNFAIEAEAQEYKYDFHLSLIGRNDNITSARVKIKNHGDKEYGDDFALSINNGLRCPCIVFQTPPIADPDIPLISFKIAVKSNHQLGKIQEIFLQNYEAYDIELAR